MLALALAALGAQAQAGDPPGRVAAITAREGSVVFAPAGEEDWTNLPPNRPLTQADRLWTDQGAKVELHLGTETLHVRDLSNIGIVELDDNAANFSLTQGAINAHVRALHPGERFEIGTPNLTARASQPGDWRIDVDPDTASTRVTVHSGTVTVYGAGGRARVLGPGEEEMFVARDLEPTEPRRRGPDAFDQWASARNAQEDRSQTAQYVPREVVGYPELDRNGTWTQDATYGPVWYPNVTVVDWAPYRQGRWEWIAPWGWTWVDDAPWGFAPYHYGRWALIGSRWCWVPTGIGPRPVYSPALVAFVGGASGSVTFTIGSSPGIAWYPLAPGEWWRPTYRTSTVYVRNVNYNYYYNGRPITYANARFVNAVTAVRVDDFNRGRPVFPHWHRVDAGIVAQAPVTTALPHPNWGGNWQRPPVAVTPQLSHVPPAIVPPAAVMAPTPAAPRRWVPQPAQATAPAPAQVQVQVQVQQPWQRRTPAPPAMAAVQPQPQVQAVMVPRHQVVPQQPMAAPQPMAPQQQMAHVPQQQMAHAPQQQMARAPQQQQMAPAPQGQAHGQHRGWQRGDEQGERGGWRR